MAIREVDAVVIGGGLAGLVSAYVLSNYGMENVLIEKGKSLGGGNKSFITPKGSIFDYGYHALDYSRSLITTRLFDKAVKGDCQVLELKRSILIDDHIIPYNAVLSEWPEELRSMIELEASRDKVGDVLSRGEIAKYYGTQFTDFVFDEILRSYPSKSWSLDNGGTEEDHAELVYPWFFPKLERDSVRDTETLAYHDNIRNRGEQYIMYPRNGGFESYINGLHHAIDKDYCDVRIGVDPLGFNFLDDHVTLNSITCDHEEIRADHYFWCAPPALLLKLLDIPVVDGVLQRIVLGSFVLSSEVDRQIHEILVGSKAHLINRISYPGLLGGRANNQVQVEFYFPNHEYPDDGEFWLSNWRSSLVRLGLIEDEGAIIEQDFRTEIRGMVTRDPLKKITESSIADLQQTGTNIIVPYFNFGPENINRVVPGAIDSVTRIISGDYSR